MTESPKVRQNQIWRDNDKRLTSRHLRICATDNFYAWCEPVDLDTGKSTGRQTRIRLNRFRPNATGYVLVRDVQQTEDAT